MNADATQLSAKSARASVITICITLVLVAVMLVAMHFYTLSRAVIEDSSVQARIIADNVVAAVLFNDESAASEMLDSLAQSPSAQAGIVVSQEGKLIAQYGVAHIEPVFQKQLPQADGYRMTINSLLIKQTIVVDHKDVGYVAIKVSLAQMYRRLLAYALITLSIIATSFGIAYLFVLKTRRALSRTEAHLHRLAHVDAVTGLPNRNAFNQALEKISSFSTKTKMVVELLMLDLDNFKVVNDTLGHANGDSLLQRVGERLRNVLDAKDVICRIGGDEFAIILMSSAVALRAEKTALQVINAVSQPFLLESHEFHITCSLGIASCMQESCDVVALTRDADTAMYHAKGLGKNTFAVFAEEMNLCMQRRALLEAHMRKALENENEFSVFYQPKLGLRSNSVIGMEALLRWNHPVLGSISPAEFIPVAEDSGLIEPLGKWVLRSVCEHVAMLMESEPLNFAISVNLSVRQLVSKTLVSDIQSYLRQWNVRPEQLCLEITESVLMENIESTIALLNELRGLGIRLSIDDFGTGYSSMAYLKTLRIDELKIDRAFIKDLPQDAEDKAIITAMLALGHSLSLTVVAEGVETAEQLAFLREAGCDSIQGFHFARPMEFEKVEAFLERHKTQPSAQVLALVQ